MAFSGSGTADRERSCTNSRAKRALFAAWPSRRTAQSRQEAGIAASSYGHNFVEPSCTPPSLKLISKLTVNVGQRMKIGECL